MNRVGLIFMTIAAMASFASCDLSSHKELAAHSDTAATQQFLVAVESKGELFTGGEGVLSREATRKPISSVAPSQTFDKLSIIIVEYQNPSRSCTKPP